MIFTPFIIIVIEFILLVILLICIIHVCYKQIVLTNHPELNNNSTVELLQTSTEPIYLPVYSVGTRKHKKNNNVQRPKLKSLVRDTLRTNSTVHQLREYIKSNIKEARKQHIVKVSPAYNELVRQSSTTITIEQQTL